ncbi:MAG: hypothetical protein R3E55_04025 [Burkholderiaceae bacterium]
MLASEARLPSGEAVQELVACRLFLDAGGHVVEQQHKAADHGLRGLGCRAVIGSLHGSHLHAQQLPSLGGGDELRRRAGHARTRLWWIRSKRMGQQLPVKHGIDGAANTDQFGAIGQSRLWREGAEQRRARWL